VNANLTLRAYGSRQKYPCGSTHIRSSVASERARCTLAQGSSGAKCVIQSIIPAPLGRADPRVYDLLVEAAEEEGIPYTVEATGRGTGTDADVVHISRSGVPTGLIGLPLRYMHSPVEVMQLDDIEAAARLVAAFALRLAADASFVR